MNIRKIPIYRSVLLTLFIVLILLILSVPAYADSESFRVSVTSDQIRISLSGIGESGTAEVYAAPANEYAKGDSLHGISSIRGNGDRIGAYRCGSSQTITTDRYTDDSRDRLYDKYYVIQNGRILAGPVYATDIASKKDAVRLQTTSKKGILLEGDDPIGSAKDLGAQQAAMNIDVTKLLYANEDAKGNEIGPSSHGGIAFRCNGKTYYFNKTEANRYDKMVSEATKAGINVTAIIVAMPDSDYSKHPVSLTYCDGQKTAVMGFNTSNQKGLEYFEAVMEFLAKRYSDTGHGVIGSYVIGNEIDHPYNYWKISKNTAKYRTGYKWKGQWIEKKESQNTFMEEYARALRVANLAIKKYAGDATVLVSLTHDWAHNQMYLRHNYAAFTRNTYSPKSILEWLGKHETERGNYDWGVAQHTYCVSLPETDIGMTDTGGDPAHPYFKISGDPDTSQYTTVSNLEILQKFLSRQEMQYNGKTRGIYLTETGISSGNGTETGEKRQAAYLAQLYYRVANLDAVKALCYYRLNDHAAEVKNGAAYGLIDTDGNKKPAYEMYRHIDSKDSFLYSNPYLPYIAFLKDGKIHSVAAGNVKSYKDVMSVTDGFDWDSAWDLEKIESAPKDTDKTDGTDYKYTAKYTYQPEKSSRNHAVINAKTGKKIRTESCVFNKGIITKQATRTQNGTLTHTCELCGKQYTETISKLKTVTPVRDYVYQGVEITPQVTVKDAAGKGQSVNQYTVSTVSGNVGSYKVNLDFNGKYKYHTSFTVTIHPDGTKLRKVCAGKKKADVYWSAQPMQTSGYQIQAAKSKSFKNAKSYTVRAAPGVKAGKTIHKTLKLQKGNWYVRVRTYKTSGRKKIHSEWSGMKKTKIR